VTRLTKTLGLLGVALAVGLLLFVLFHSSGPEQIAGSRAGNLYGGNEFGVDVPLRRGESEMIALTEVKNVGNSPIRIESVKPQSTSSELRATDGRIWFKHLRKNEEGLPAYWPGWPPKNLPIKDGAWWIAHPDYLALPTTATIQPGETARLPYGISLRTDPSPDLKVTSVRVTFQQDGRTIVWTIPETVGVYPPGHRPKY
jgi:hypothetical protein